MSQRTVQMLIGQIVTDEELRRRFVREPREVLMALSEQGVDLTTGEIEALVRTDRRLWNAAARRLHPRLQRCSLCPDQRSGS
jgi:hypothetical protein